VSPRRVFVVAWKEAIYLWRTWLLFYVVIQPLVLGVLWGYCASLELRDVKLAVLDLARTPESRSVVRTFERSRCFQVVARPAAPSELERELKDGTASIGLVIARDPGKAAARGQAAPVQIAIDGTDWSVATLGASDASRIIAAASFERSHERVRPNDEVAGAATRGRYLPDFDSSIILLLGAVVYMTLIPIYNISDTVLLEYENGTSDILRSSRLLPTEYWLGLTSVYVLVGLWACVFELGMIELIVPIPCHGSPWLLLVGLGLLSLLHNNLGCVLAALVSVRRTRTIVAILFMLGELALAGFLVPLATLPPWVRETAEFVPLKHGLVLIRSIFLKGSTPTESAHELLALAGMTVVTIPFAIRSVRVAIARSLG
jgi:ABC-2 type transport system permease protein